ncbi:hypothetical protein EZV62_017016 [Acer yangbiense]|uniref:Disease resistance protein At4g27190-like leucine-rich repeats domain-containing protein n=1 Tax=Acer yangbiense TaxID=1000413 RepID=A0A5C7HQ53_9ROSI|nr:hypothetical protein EZV62_017016 [Acer yangbiense]
MVFSRMDNMRKIWHHQLTPASFSKIDSFEVYDCHNLLNVFPSNMLGRLQKLEELVVSNCKSVEVIFEELDISSCMVEENVAKEDVKAVPKLVFPRLTRLKLADLPRLRVLYPGLYISEWPMLKTLRIWGCKKVEKLTSEFQSLQENHGETQHQKFSIQQPLFIVDKVAFPNLEELSLEWNCNATELMNENFSGNSCKLKDLELKDASIEERGDREENPIIFSKLEYLELHCLPRLTSFYTGSYAIEFPSLQQIIDRFRDIENFTVSNFPHLKEVWHKQFLGCYFRNLKSLVVDDKCCSLRYIFTPSVALGLVQLQELKLKNCAVLEAIIVIEEEKMMNTLFPNLHTPKLIDLPKLSSFCNFVGNAIELPSLATLWIENCPNMETFISNFTGADTSTIKDIL